MATSSARSVTTVSTDGCLLCGNTTAAPFISTNQGTLVKCSCGLVYQWPQPTPEALDALYAEDYVPFQQKISSNTWESTHAGWHYRILRKIKHIFIPLPVPPEPDMVTRKTVLDFGHGNGRWLLQMKQEHPLWTLYGYDINDKPLKGITTLSSLPELMKMGRVFDLITLTHVVEHLPDPKSTITQLTSLLKPDGEMVIEVPNINSWKFKVFRKNFIGLCLPYHLYHFTVPTMTELVRQCGLTVQSVTFLGSAKGTLRSIYNALGITRSITPYETLVAEFFSNIFTQGRADTEALQVTLRI